MFLSVVMLLTTFSIYLVFKDDTKTVEAGWYSSSWTNRKQITIDRTKVSTASSTTLSNFPVLFSRTDSELKTVANGGLVGKTDGTDILFTSANGTTKLDHEIEKYASTTGETIIWVRVPTLSPSADTVLYIYYGNAGAADQQNKTGVWDSSYKGAWHLPDGSSLSATNTVTSVSATISGASATAGKIDGAASFNGGTNKITSDLTSHYAQGTYEAWVKPTGAGGGNLPRIIDKIGVGGSQNIFQIYRNSSTGALQMNVMWTGGGTGGEGLWYTANNVLLTDNVYHVVVTYDTSSASNNPIAYINGSVVAMPLYTPALSGSVVTNTDPWVMGNRATDNARGWAGWMDEVRISNTIRSPDWIVTEYNNQSSPETFFSFGASSVENSSSDSRIKSQGSSTGWYSTGGTWTNRKQISINPAQLSTTATSTFSNFPMLFSVTDADLKFTGSGGKVASSTGADILFTSADGTTKLKHELERYVSTTGETIAWVQIPTLSAGTIIYIYFGNASASDQQSVKQTWDSSYKGVYHLKDGTTLNLTDSTGNEKNGTNNAGVTAGAGQIDGAASFNNAVYQYVSLPSSTFGSGSVTVELWTKFTTFTGYWPMFSAYTSDADSMEIFIDNTNRLFGGNYNNRALTDSNLVTGQWYYVVLTAVSGGATQFYINGVASGSTGTTNFSTYTVAPNIGRRLSYYYNNIIDEVRVSSGIARSADWIKTQYNNQVNPSLFYSYGATESQNRVNSSSVPMPAVKSRGGVKFR